MILILIFAIIKLGNYNSKKQYDINNDWYSEVFGVGDFEYEVKNSKWRIKYFWPKLKKQSAFDEDWYSGVFEGNDFKFEVKISKI